MFTVRRNDRGAKRLRARLREASKRFKDELLDHVKAERPSSKRPTSKIVVSTSTINTEAVLSSSLSSSSSTFFSTTSPSSSTTFNRLPPVTPMLASVLDTNRLPDYGLTTDYVYEEKFDGERMIAVIPLNTTAEVRGQFYSRALKRQADSTFPHEIRLQPDTRHDCMLDGELIYLDPETERPIAVCDTGRRAGLRIEYRVFDVLYVDGHPVHCKPLTERKRLLNEVLVETEHVRIVQYRPVESIDQLWATFDLVTRERNGEGLMLKRATEPYRPGERAWLKMKPLHIEGRREEFDLRLHRLLPDKNGVANVLECGYYDGDSFRLVCRTSSGIDSTARHQLRMLTDERGYFERPTVATIVADKITEQRRSLRHPVFHRLRLDLETVEVDSRLEKK